MAQFSAMQNNPMYKTLLKWSLSQTDGTAPSQDTQEMTEEKRAFLDRVMKEMVEDESAAMTDLVSKMKGPEETDEEVVVKEKAIEELCDRVVSDCLFSHDVSCRRMTMVRMSLLLWQIPCRKIDVPHCADPMVAGFRTVVLSNCELRAARWSRIPGPVLLCE